MIKRLLLSIFLATLCSAANAQNIDVTGFEMRNDVVEIYYSADVPKGVKLTNFKVYAIINGVSRELDHISGDVGTIKEGGNKVIYWNCFKDLDEDNLTASIQFNVTCTQVGVSSRYQNPKAFNMFFEYCYTPSTPLTFGIGMGGRVGVYARVGTNAAKNSYNETLGLSAGLYVITFKWLNLNLGYNHLRLRGVALPGYEVGATVLFGRKKWYGINAGYIGSFQNARYGEFYVGVTLNWNTGV